MNDMYINDEVKKFDFINTKSFKIESSVFHDPLLFLYERVKDDLKGFNFKILDSYIDDYLERVTNNEIVRTKTDLIGNYFIGIITDYDSFVFPLVEFEYDKVRKQADLTKAKFVFIYEFDLMVKTLTKVSLDKFFTFLKNFDGQDIPFAGEITGELFEKEDNFFEYLAGKDKELVRKPIPTIILRKTANYTGSEAVMKKGVCPRQSNIPDTLWTLENES